MLSRNPRRTPAPDEDLVSDRTKKINSLAEVLEQQKMKVKQLLQSQKHRQAKQLNSHLQTQNRELSTNRQCSEVYQRICTQVIDIGNRVLPSARRKKLTKEAVSEQRHTQQVHEEEDKQMEYLKSEEYKVYLENITKDHAEGKDDLISKMRQARNHNAYLNPIPQKQTPRPSFSPRQYSRDQRLHYYPSARNKEMQRNRELELLLPRDETLILDQNSLRREMSIKKSIYDSPTLKTMVHTPTMKDIHKDMPSEKLHQKKQLVPKREATIRIQSKTIDLQYSEPIFVRATHGKIRVTQEICRHEQQSWDKENGKICKDWDLQHLKIKPNFKNERMQLKQIDNFQSYKYSGNRNKQSSRSKKHAKKVIRQQMYSPVYYENSKRYKHKYTKECKRIQSKKNKAYQLQSQSYNSDSQSSLSPSKPSNLKEIAYKIDFKLQCPRPHKQMPHQYPIQSLPKSKRKVKRTFKLQSVRQEVEVPLTQKRALDSQTTSTVAQSDHAHYLTPSKPNKLTVVTPSRLKERSSKF